MLPFLSIDRIVCGVCLMMVMMMMMMMIIIIIIIMVNKDFQSCNAQRIKHSCSEAIMIYLPPA